MDPAIESAVARHVGSAKLPRRIRPKFFAFEIPVVIEVDRWPAPSTGSRLHAGRVSFSAERAVPNDDFVGLCAVSTRFPRSSWVLKETFPVFGSRKLAECETGLASALLGNVAAEFPCLKVMEVLLYRLGQAPSQIAAQLRRPVKVPGQETSPHRGLASVGIRCLGLPGTPAQLRSFEQPAAFSEC